jgi:hypothetical protein
MVQPRASWFDHIRIAAWPMRMGGNGPAPRDFLHWPEGATSSILRFAAPDRGAGPRAAVILGENGRADRQLGAHLRLWRDRPPCFRDHQIHRYCLDREAANVGLAINSALSGLLRQAGPIHLSAAFAAGPPLRRPLVCAAASMRKLVATLTLASSPAPG